MHAQIWKGVSNFSTFQDQRCHNVLGVSHPDYTVVSSIINDWHRICVFAELLSDNFSYLSWLLFSEDHFSFSYSLIVYLYLPRNQWFLTNIHEAKQDSDMLVIVLAIHINITVYTFTFGGLKGYNGTDHHIKAESQHFNFTVIVSL